MKKVIIAESIFLFFLGILILTHLLNISWSNKEIFKSCQSSEINYESHDPYCISVIKSQHTFGVKYFIWVANKAESSYGHAINYPAPYIVSEQDIQNTKINWNNDGIEIDTYLNTKILIPKKNFIGGR